MVQVSQSQQVMQVLLNVGRKAKVHTLYRHWHQAGCRQGQEGLLQCRLSRGGGAAFGEAAATAPPEQVAQVAQAMAANPGARGMDLAAKMMEKMGWKSGLGLGRNKQVSHITSVYVLSPSVLCNKPAVGTLIHVLASRCFR